MAESIRGVGTTNPISPATAGQAGSARSTDAAAPAASTSAGADLANVAQTEALLQTIVEAANNVPGIDQAKIAELQQAIASGAYRSNPKAIAAKMAELEDLLAAAGVTR
jgi:negative regulator of flagellin synthesis FlgM